MSASVRASGGGRKSKQSLVGVGDQSIQRVNPPDQLRDENAVVIWKQQSKLMIARGTLAREDLPLLMAYCNNFSIMLEADSEIAQRGFYSETAQGGLKTHPAVNIRKEAIAQMKSLGSLLGLDPLSRGRVLGTSGPKEGQQGNEFDEF
ncbi:phage terminase small subunit P27 family [Paraferrimonas haliotis]|uniref:Phage terminase small subunit P27 family n=1 Tax=Paraferrimonas haliotis TaxID=2013866 RepID=A0AA37TXK5_9GAMM|nr:phage terminase small subunit P27 family [Paraferrimonas haliotis]GLS83231.1 hypothetical protein GCM10007894_12080 [Paraferrimonas haliotis]